MLIGAQLQGADFFGAHLMAAAFSKAQLQSTSLEFAELQGASLSDAQLQSASLTRADLQGAVLDRAQLQGASLDGVTLIGASFREVFVWRADARKADWKETRVAAIETSPTEPCELGVDQRVCGWTTESFSKLKNLVARAVRDVLVGNDLFHSHDAMGLIKPRLDLDNALEGEEEMAKDWAARERENPAAEAYAKSVAGQWRETGCAADGAPYVLPALIPELETIVNTKRVRSDAAKSLAAVFLDEAHCPGGHGLSEADKAKLKKLAAPVPPQAPKPDAKFRRDQIALLPLRW